MKPINQKDTDDEVFIMSFSGKLSGIIPMIPAARLVLYPAPLSR